MQPNSSQRVVVVILRSPPCWIKNKHARILGRHENAWAKSKYYQNITKWTTLWNQGTFSWDASRAFAVIWTRSFVPRPLWLLSPRGSTAITVSLPAHLKSSSTRSKCCRTTQLVSWLKARFHIAKHETTWAGLICYALRYVEGVSMNAKRYSERLTSITERTQSHVMVRISLLLKLIMIKIKFLFLIHASKQLRRCRRRTRIRGWSITILTFPGLGWSKCFAHAKLYPYMTAQSQDVVIFGDRATVSLDEEQFSIGIHGVCSHYALRYA